MRKSFASAVAIVVSSVALFLVHEPIADALPKWVGEHMDGIEIKRPPYGIDVITVAVLSSVEYGAGLFFGYVCVRAATPGASTLARALCLFALCLTLLGNLIRFPLMQWVVGNPVDVTLVQHAAVWLPYLAGCLAVAYAYEGLRSWAD